jgi:hypothetical protein
MTNKKNKKTSAVVVNVAPANQSKKKNRSRRRGGRNSKPIWADIVCNPFEYTPQHIPDEQTRPSGLVTTRYHMSYKPLIYNDLPMTIHNGGILVRPYPDRWLLSLGEDVGGNIRPNREGLDSDLASGMVWIDAPNLDAMIGGYGPSSNPAHSTALVRCVAMGVRITYEGTELQRAGSFIGVQCNNNSESTSFSLADSGGVYYHFDPFSVYTSKADVTPKPSEFMNYGIRTSRSRISDSVFEFVWVPSGVPKYQMMLITNYNENVKTTTASTNSLSTIYSSPVGSPGLDVGEGGIFVLIEGDTVTAENKYGNPYAVDLIAHWEVVPHDLYSITYPVDLSPFVTAELTKSLNAFGSMTSGVSRSLANTFSGNRIGQGSASAANGFTAWSDYMPSGNTMQSFANAMASLYLTRRTQRQRLVGWRP